jgi:hypothetical protein
MAIADALTDDHNDMRHGDRKCRVTEDPSENENDTAEPQNEQQMRDLHDETNIEGTTNVDDVLYVFLSLCHITFS